MKAMHWLGLLLIVAGSVQAQENPVQWKVVSKKVDAKTYELHISAIVASPWHIYSQYTPEGGPLPTKIQFTKNPLVIISGKTKEIGIVKEKFEEVFEIKVKYFSGDVEFVQVVQLKNDKVKTTLSGSINYMACTDEQCLPPTSYSFAIPVNQ